MATQTKTEIAWDLELARKDVARLQEKLANLYQRTPAIVTETEQRRANLERLLVLAGSAEHPIWKVVLSYADEHARNEEAVALGPNLRNADRQYNAGRAGGALDFAMALRDLQAKAEAEARKLKAE